MAAVPTTGFPISELSSFQKSCLDRIWKSNRRQLVDVRPTSEQQSSSSSTTSSSSDAVVQCHSYRFVVRLYHFFLDFLSQATVSLQTVIGNPRKYLKHPSQSCLREILQVFVFSSSRETPPPPHPHCVQLLHGRRVLSLPHAEFLSELNTYELQGRPHTTEFVQKHSFGAFLYHVPEEAVTVISSAVRLALVTLYTRQHRNATQCPAIDPFLDHSQLVIRFVRVQPVVQMMDIKTSVVGKLLSVRGHVVKARPKQLRVATADFSCCKCGTISTHEFIAGRYSTPQSCHSCKSKSFHLLRPTARYQNVQELRLQETQDESIAQAGRTPRQLVVELTADLVDTCRPGDTVMVAAVVAAVNTAHQQGRYGKRAQETSTYTLYLQGHSVTTMSESTSQNHHNQHQHQQQSVVYTSQQLQAITQLCHADHRSFGMVERRAFPFDLLVRSLCPSIIGHYQVKAGLLLSLLGGTPATVSDKEHSMRCNSHILIVGDPGMGKSQMLLAASQLAARSVYVGGNTSSTTGLTVTLTKESSGESGMEVGALVLSDQGICCIDEFDKMHKSHQDGLLEAMEQQQVSIAKAGVVASLPARCSVIAAANPKNGSYNMSKTVAENLNMAKPILSRFDLVFILRDRADKEQDQLVSSNIINLYRNPNQKKTIVTATTSTAETTAATTAFAIRASGEKARNSSDDAENQRLPLRQRLAWVHEFQKQPLPASLVRDYIAYAREYCKPKLTPEAAIVLKNYFMELRYPPDGRRKRDTVPITTRQLEALIRLCQARAKACLRDYCLKEDALDVVELMSLSVEQVHSDETGAIDPGRGGAGGRSNRKLKKVFVSELHRLVGIGAECGMDDLRRIADQVQCGLSEFASLVEDLRLQGVLIKKANGRYQVVS